MVKGLCTDYSSLSEQEVKQISKTVEKKQPTVSFCEECLGKGFDKLDEFYFDPIGITYKCILCWFKEENNSFCEHLSCILFTKKEIVEMQNSSEEKEIGKDEEEELYDPSDYLIKVFLFFYLKI